MPLPIFRCHQFVLILITGRCFSCVNIRIPIHFLQLHFITFFLWIFHGRFNYLDTNTPCVDGKMFAVLSLYSFWWMQSCDGHVVNIRTKNNKYPIRKIGDIVLKAVLWFYHSSGSRNHENLWKFHECLHDYYQMYCWFNFKVIETMI